MRFLRHILTKKKIIIPVLLGLVLVISFCAFNQVKAQDSIVSKVEQGAFTWFISTPILFFVSLLARLLTNLIRLLVWIAQYNDFINSPAVSKGWIIIRDICNMSFILVLLVIAFCTVLKIENYSYKKLLGKLVMAAVLVNFSKFICGFLIDISQIIMLTFVNAFKAAAEGNFAQMLGLEKIMYYRKDLGGTGISGGETFIALILGLIMTAVAVIVVGIITIILAMRIVTIWFLVLLSPLVFVANILPGQQSYSKKWWDSFNHNLIVGPAMAFMLWLSLAVVQDQGSTIYKTMVSSETAQNIETIEASTTGDKLVVAITETGQPQYILNFIIGIAMLVGSLMVAQQLGVAGSQIAGKGIKGMQNFASGAVKGITKPITEPIRGLGIGAGKLVRDIEAATHIPLTKERRLAIGAEKKRKEVEGREGIWGRRIERGMLRGMPTGVEEWADTMSLKGFPKTAIRGTKAVFKRDLAWREKAFESNNNAEFLKTARDSSISESGYKKLEKDKEDNQARKNDLKKAEEVYDKEGGRMVLPALENFQQDLVTRRNGLDEKKDKDKIQNIDNIINQIEDAKSRAKANGSTYIQSTDIDPSIRKDFSTEAEKWFKQENLNLGKKISELETQKRKFKNVDKEEIEEQLKGLTAEIAKVEFRDPNHLKQKITDTLNNIAQQTTDKKAMDNPETRRNMARQVWDLKNDVKNSEMDEKSKNELLMNLDKPIEGLNKGKISDNESMKITQNINNYTHQANEQEIMAEQIHSAVITPDQRQAIQRGIMSESEKVKGVEDPQELIKLYLKAEKEKDANLARAIMMKLNANLDINELQESLGLEQNYKGMAGLGERLNKQFKIPLQEAFTFINDLSYQNKHQGAFRFMAGVIRDQKTGLLRATKDNEHHEIVKIESGKVDKESFYRKGFWGGIFGKHQDSITGTRVPIWDDTTRDIIHRDLHMIALEISKGRLQTEIERDLSHRDIVKNLEEMRSIPGISGDDLKNLNEIIKNSQNKQSQYWGVNKKE